MVFLRVAVLIPSLSVFHFGRLWTIWRHSIGLCVKPTGDDGQE